MSIPFTSTRTVSLGSLGGIPVAASPLWLLTTAALAFRDGIGWDDPYFAFALTASVLVHELGHALVAKAYDLDPSIELHLFGGLCKHRLSHDYKIARRVVAAGPAAGLLLAAISYAAWLSLDAADAPFGLRYTAWFLAVNNLGVSVINALPIWPMDGGQFVDFTLRDSMGAAAATRRAQEISRMVAGIIMVVALLYSAPVVALMAAGFLFYNHQRLQQA